MRAQSSKVLPYHFELASVVTYINNEDSSSESQINIRKQASHRVIKEYKWVQVHNMFSHVEQH